MSKEINLWVFGYRVHVCSGVVDVGSTHLIEVGRMISVNLRGWVKCIGWRQCNVITSNKRMSWKEMNGKGFWSKRKLRFPKHAYLEMSLTCIRPIVFKIFESFKSTSGCYFGQIIFRTMESCVSKSSRSSFPNSRTLFLKFISGANLLLSLVK